MNIGFIGTGKIASSVIIGISKSKISYRKIYISPRNTPTGFIVGDIGSDIDISVVHPDAIGIQNPYEDLDYGSLPESP